MQIKLLAFASLFVSSVVFADTANDRLTILKNEMNCLENYKSKNCRMDLLSEETKSLILQYQQANEQLKTIFPQLSRGGKVYYIFDTILEIDANIVKLMGGAIISLDLDYFGLIMDDVIVIKEENNNVYLVGSYGSYTGTILRPAINNSSGLITRVIKNIGGGAVLQTEEGVLLEFSSYDQYDTDWWRPPYRVLIDLNKMKMWNLDTGKAVDIRSIVE